MAHWWHNIFSSYCAKTNSAMKYNNILRFTRGKLRRVGIGYVMFSVTTTGIISLIVVDNG